MFSVSTLKMYFLLQKCIDNVRGTKIFGKHNVIGFTTSKSGPG